MSNGSITEISDNGIYVKTEDGILFLSDIDEFESLNLNKNMLFKKKNSDVF